MREIYFHEDDYCQQQLLPEGAAGHVASELKAIEKFADAHQTPGGFGWTEMYARPEAPVELRALQIKRDDLAALISPILSPFDVVYTGYSSYRQQCKHTAAWGRSERCAVFAEWGDDGVITEIWTEFFDLEDISIRAASAAIATLGKCYPLIYVDWAWGYACEVSNEETLASVLREKLQTIAENIKKSQKG